MSSGTKRMGNAIHEANNKEQEVQEMNNTTAEETMENGTTEEMTFEDTVAQLRAQQLALVTQIEALKADKEAAEQVKLSKLDVWKLKHPKASKRLSKIGLGVGLVGAWMLGGAVQERRDAKTVQKAIDDGTLVRAKDLEPIDVDAVEVDETTVE